MSRGKAVAQGSHVSVLATRRAENSDVKSWLSNGGKKITLVTESKGDLQDVIGSARSSDLPVATVRDRGHTELDPNTLTAGAIGPADDSLVDRHTAQLSLY